MDSFELAEQKFEEACQHLNRADYAQALKPLMDAFKIDETNDYYSYRLAETYYFLGDYNRALRFIDVTWDLNDDNWAAFCLRAVIARELKERFFASGYLSHAVSLDRVNSYKMLFLIGHSRMVQRKYDLAVQIFKMMMTIDTSVVDDIGLVACALAESGCSDEGLVHCERILKLDPENAFSHYAVAVCHEKKENYIPALEWLFKAKELGLKDADSDINRVLLLYEKQAKTK